MDLVVASSLIDLVASSPVYGVSPEVPVAARWSGTYRSSRSGTSSVSRRRGVSRGVGGLVSKLDSSTIAYRASAGFVVLLRWTSDSREAAE